MAEVITEITTHLIVQDNCGDIEIIETVVQSTITIESDAVELIETPSDEVVSEKNTDVEILTIAEQGPPGKDGLGVLEIDGGLINPTFTGIIDSVPISLYRSVKWIVTLSDDVNSVYKKTEVSAIHNGVLPSHNEAGRIGGNINITDIVDINSGQLRLLITNDYSAAIGVKVLRLVTTI